MADTLVRTLAEWGQFFKENGQPHDVIELMDQDNSINDDIPWMEANSEDGHKSVIRTSLPTVYWRRLYQGVPYSKTGVSQVKDACALMEARNNIDKKLLDLHGSQAAAYRAQEDRGFLEAFRQKLATTLFYGNSNTTPDEFNGLGMRYPTKSSPNVVDAAGSGSACTDMWGIVWGGTDVHGIFPKGSKSGLSMRVLPEQDVLDASNNPYRAVATLFEWNVGLTVRDWRSVVRICNIDTTKLTLKKGETGFVDLHRLTIIAKNKIPTAKRNRLVWYCNQDVMTALELQASDAGNVQLMYGELFNSKNVPFLHGRPVRQCDAILSTQTALS